MSEPEQAAEPVEVTEAEDKPTKVKKPKVKKRPSDFEILRTILQRTSERKQAYLVKNLGEDPDILFFCSVNEKGFTYGNPELSIAILQIIDPGLREIVDSHFNKLYGVNEGSSFSGFVNIRDQISELGKTKGEQIEGIVETNAYGTAWLTKTNANEQTSVSYLALAIESLFHVQLIADYCKNYRPLLDGDDPRYLYYPYTHEDSETSSIITLPPGNPIDHPLVKLYPFGYRTLATKGLDVILTKCVTGDFPYPVTDESMIVFQDRSSACHLVHRVVADGWRMVMTRPNAVYFPALETTIPMTGTHNL